MDSQAFQNGDVSIEEMIEKLNKDWQEETAVVLENRQLLERVGAHLAQVSPRGKASETQRHDNGTDKHWRQLLDLGEARVKRMQETLVAVQHLEGNMSSLQSWLADTETRLSQTITYHTCESQEIQRKLNQQQEIQRDIEAHSAGMKSVLGLCEVMLQDCDICANDVEFESIQQAARTLDQRWRNICTMATERRRRIEETGSLWEKFLEDFTYFKDWLQASENVAALSNSSGLLYTTAKEELKKFEVLEREVLEKVTQLDLIIKQYKRLEREDRTDDSGQLRDMMNEGKQRWEDLNKSVASVLNKLKTFIGEREAFETAKDGVLIWVTTMDLHLTDIEHFSEGDLQDKLTNLQAFKQEISVNQSRIDSTFHQGRLLIQKTEALDAAVIEEELEELDTYCEEVFDRVNRYYKKLTDPPFVEKDHGLYGPEDIEELAKLLWSECVRDSPPGLPLCSKPALMQDGDSGRGSPSSMDSIPLEWDHEYDDFSGVPGAPFSGDMATLDTQVHHPHQGQSHQALHTSHLYLPDWSDLVSLASTDTQNTESVEQRDMIAEQTLSEELLYGLNGLNYGPQLSSKHHSLWATLWQTEVELEQLREQEISSSSQDIKQHIMRLKQIHAELLESWQEVTLSQGPFNGEPVTTKEANDCPQPEHALSDQLQRLMDEVTEVISELERSLDIHDGLEASLKHSLAQSEPSLSRPRSRSPVVIGPVHTCPEGCHRTFLQRVLWASLPFQLLLLVLLSLACLLPPDQEDHTYALAKILVQNFSPSLHYTNGPPPF
ncbi:hypothetical protein AGOR_G00110170 [Albula goreensis]|uniref:KASH domain-containing protein n=1 Tax=Albula goreensis TaxID=1534307 RepID=A0A8T3DL84_9TELE|nr:hypothetical protein AGOR_G00110170 [Albula goreensis]